MAGLWSEWNERLIVISLVKCQASSHDVPQRPNATCERHLSRTRHILSEHKRTLSSLFSSLVGCLMVPS